MSDLSKTRRDLVEQALGNLGVLAAGQAPAAEDVDIVDDHVDSFLSYLNSREIVYVPDVEQIPLDVFLPLGVLLSEVMAPHFGVPVGNANDPDSVAGRAILARRDLAVITRAAPTGQTMVSEYF